MADSLSGPESGWRNMTRKYSTFLVAAQIQTTHTDSAGTIGQQHAFFRVHRAPDAVKWLHPAPPDFLSAAAVCYNMAGCRARCEAGRSRTLLHDTVQHPP